MIFAWIFCWIISSDLFDTSSVSWGSGICNYDSIEAYTSSLRSNFTDPLALKAISMIDENLIKSYKGNEECRALMHEAQCLAGMAFSNALLGIVHSMAHKVGAVFHIPHGCANAIFLPYVIQYNRKACEDRYADIAEVLGVKGKD